MRSLPTLVYITIKAYLLLDCCFKTIVEWNEGKLMRNVEKKKKLK